MMRCLCCNKELISPSEYETQVFWHERCIRSFFGTKILPEIDCSDEELEKLADSAVNKGLTVPGVQKKLSVHLSDSDKAARLTIVDYPAGFILKPQSEDFAFLPESEFMVMKMAEAAKIKTVPNALLNVDGKYSYIVRRIDRNAGRLLAMEDFCQLSERLTEDKYRGSYEGCGRVIKRYSRNVGLDLAELFYRLVFCFITGNSDMHLKNFSLIEDAPGSRVFGLSAAYDLLPVNIIMPEDKEQTALTLNGKKANLGKKDFLVLAQNLGIGDKTAMGLIKQLTVLEERFKDIVTGSYIPDETKNGMKRLIEERMAKLV